MLLEVLRVILFIVFGFSAILLILVICLQEGKGGGLAAAFGGAGGEAFGVGAAGINKFTAWLAAVFVVSAIILGATQEDSVSGESDPTTTETPADGAAGETAGGEDGGGAADEGGTGGGEADGGSGEESPGGGGSGSGD